MPVTAEVSRSSTMIAAANVPIEEVTPSRCGRCAALGALRSRPRWRR